MQAGLVAKNCNGVEMEEEPGLIGGLLETDIFGDAESEGV